MVGMTRIRRLEIDAKYKCCSKPNGFLITNQYDRDTFKAILGWGVSNYHDFGLHPPVQKFIEINEIHWNPLKSWNSLKSRNGTAPGSEAGGPQFNSWSPAPGIRLWIHWNSLKSMKSIEIIKIYWNRLKFDEIHRNSLKSNKIYWNLLKSLKSIGSHIEIYCNPLKFNEIHRHSLKSNETIQIYWNHWNPFKAIASAYISATSYL